jgi:hypothetical protein
LHFLDSLHFSISLQQLRLLAVRPDVLEPLAAQLILIAGAFAAAWGIRVATRGWIARVTEFVTARYPALRILDPLLRLAMFSYVWLLLAIAGHVFSQFGGRHRLIDIAATLTGLWIDVTGIAVHIACARVAEKAANGEVLVSSTVRDIVAGSGVRFGDRGSHALRGFPIPLRLYAAEP